MPALAPGRRPHGAVTDISSAVDGATVLPRVITVYLERDHDVHVDLVLTSLVRLADRQAGCGGQGWPAGRFQPHRPILAAYAPDRQCVTGLAG